MNGAPLESPGRALLALAWPGALGLLLDNLYRANDLFWVRDLGTPASSAVSVAGMASILTFAAYGGLGFGTLSLSARAHGAARLDRARSVLRLALGLTLLVGLVVAVLGLGFLEPLVAYLIPADGDAAGLAVERAHLRRYLQPIFAGGACLCLATVVEHAFLAARDTRTPLMLQLLAVALNCGLNPLLIYGLGPVPALGTAGAGVATVLSRLLVGGLGLAILSRRLGGSGPDPDFELGRTLARLAGIAAPIFCAIAVFSLVYQVLLHEVFPPFGEVGRATLGAGFVLEGLAFCLIWGIGMASGSLAANALGAGSVVDAERIVARAVGFVLVFVVPVTVLFLLIPETLASALTDDPDVRREVGVYLRALAWSQWAIGLQGVFDETMLAAGWSLPVTLSNIAWNLVRIPLAWFLAVQQGHGLPGIWWAINLSSFGKAATGLCLLRLGRWKRTGL